MTVAGRPHSCFEDKRRTLREREVASVKLAVAPTWLDIIMAKEGGGEEKQ